MYPKNIVWKPYSVGVSVKWVAVGLQYQPWSNVPRYFNEKDNYSVLSYEKHWINTNLNEKQDFILIKKAK